MKVAAGVVFVLVLVGLALWSLGDLRVRPPGDLGVCPDTPRERAFALAANRAHAEHLDDLERAGTLTASAAEERAQVRAERERLEACDYLRSD